MITECKLLFHQDALSDWKIPKCVPQCAGQSGGRDTLSDIIGGPEVGTISTEGSLATSIKSPNTRNLWPNNSTAACLFLSLAPKNQQNKTKTH